jgi:hypothetical protein
MFCLIVAAKPFSLMHVQSLTLALSPTLTMMFHLHMLIHTSNNTTNTIQLEVEYNDISIYNNFEEIESMAIFFELNLLRPTRPTNVF